MVIQKIVYTIFLCHMLHSKCVEKIFPKFSEWLKWLLIDASLKFSSRKAIAKIKLTVHYFMQHAIFKPAEAKLAVSARPYTYDGDVTSTDVSRTYMYVRT